MVYVLAFVCLLLAAAVVTLFAMLGELYARVGPAPDPTGQLDEAKVGQRPDTWPKELARMATASDAVLLVLSTSCASCTQVAAQLRDQFDTLAAGYDTGVVLSTADRERAETFVREHGLPRDSVYVDVAGEWVTEAFGVQTSPSALVLRDGELTSALVFTDIAALQSAVVPVKAE
jgi:hypothetical protein